MVFFLNYINYLYKYFFQKHISTWETTCSWRWKLLQSLQANGGVQGHWYWPSPCDRGLSVILRKRLLQQNSVILNTNQDFLISTQFKAARGRSFESCLWIWIFFDPISKQNVPLRNNVFIFLSRNDLINKFDGASQLICLHEVGLFFSPRALKASKFFS